MPTLPSAVLVVHFGHESLHSRILKLLRAWKLPFCLLWCRGEPAGMFRDHRSLTHSRYPLPQERIQELFFPMTGLTAPWLHSIPGRHEPRTELSWGQEAEICPSFFTFSLIKESSACDHPQDESDYINLMTFTFFIYLFACGHKYSAANLIRKRAHHRPHAGMRKCLESDWMRSYLPRYLQ